MNDEEKIEKLKELKENVNLLRVLDVVSEDFKVLRKLRKNQIDSRKWSVAKLYCIHMEHYSKSIEVIEEFIKEYE